MNYSVDAPVTGETSTNLTSSTLIPSGASTVVTLHIVKGYLTLSSGTSVVVMLRSAGGYDYLAMVTLV